MKILLEHQQTTGNFLDLWGLHRLGDVIVGSQGEGPVAILLGPLGGDHHDRYIGQSRVFTDQTNQFQTIHDRHVDVGKNQIEPFAGDFLKAVNPIRRLSDRHSRQTFEGESQQLPHGR